MAFAFPMRPKVLIVDDEPAVRESLRHLLGGDFFVVTAASGNSARRVWHSEAFSAVLLDILLPDCSGISLLEEFKKESPSVPVVMITGTRQIKTAVTAMKLGAYDYITKPFNEAELYSALEGALEYVEDEKNAGILFSRADEEGFFGGIIGRSRGMIETFSRVVQVMNTTATIIIYGESGTGKELIARAVHFYGVRRSMPFVPVHAASLQENLLESELFGHERGAFTGAVCARKGVIEAAEGGTLFLDEVGDVPMSVQVKLLRVLQERELRRVGGTKNIKVNVRVIAAANKDLAGLVEKGLFREDLFYRINVVPVYLPPLRERQQDIPVLAYHFLKKFRKDTTLRIKGFRKDAMAVLERYGWPGNVRELENLIRQLSVTSAHEWISKKDLPVYMYNKRPMVMPANTLEEAVSSCERRVIEDALAKSGGVISRAACMLGTTRRVLKYKIDKLDICLP